MVSSIPNIEFSRKNKIAWKKILNRKKTNTNAQKLMKTQRGLTKTYQKRTTRIHLKIRNYVEDWESQLTWLTVNEVSRRKSNSGVNLKVAIQEERP